jgi:uncharacterized protein YjbI with pentapeptide repeats
MAQFEIKHRLTGAVMFACELSAEVAGREYGFRLGFAVKKAVEARADLRFANLQFADLQFADLRFADLRFANLQSANLQSADLQFADLRSADLRFANLQSANLQSADLQFADLRSADLRFANLQSANLQSADLQFADLRFANLQSANLQSANLQSADLQFADLQSANLQSADNADFAIARTRILADGDLIGWKKCGGRVIVKLQIPADAKRSHASGRKCRAEFVRVLEVIGAEVGISAHDGKTAYRVGETVTPDAFCDDWQQECAQGVHFFITRAEAEAY